MSAAVLEGYDAVCELLMDNLWHVKKAGGGEVGDIIFPLLPPNERFSGGFRRVFEGLWEMETNWDEGSGAVFLLRKPGAHI